MDKKSGCKGDGSCKKAANEDHHDHNNNGCQGNCGKSCDQTPHEDHDACGGCQPNEWEFERAELIETLQRLAAEFDNFKKRMMRDQQEQQAMASAEIIKDILPTIDNFELCLSVNKDISENARKGLEMVYASLISNLESRGLASIDALNKPFDPRIHEALLSEPGEPKNTVIEILQKGYILNNKVIRTAKVKITK